MSRSSRITVLLAVITVLATTVQADSPVCAYPCLPSPNSGGVINSYPPPPPAATDGGAGGGFGGSYPPPPPGGFPLSPPGVMPGFLPPPYSAVPAGPAPPPPNPVLPWFPWYYQHDNPITGSTTSASPPPAVHRRTTCMVAPLLHLCLVILLRAS
ncbi:wiskott-Aldrich syndrome protein homolog [Lolium rigidum]|uniref:wiskott-Aldrich syndrome protein homolog n=1 Tax=Lolium rigidum TaxID=89674 RepID=UPI001F5C3EA0|nr:wiskott-Aldrich syndrome protein homolog [Lolium rigidum]